MESAPEITTAAPVATEATLPPQHIWFWVFVLVVLTSLVIFGQFAFAGLLSDPGGGCGGI